MKQLSLGAQKIASLLDRVTDKVTSYRLVLYLLLALVGWALAGSFFRKVPYGWYEIVISAGWLAAVCWSANKLFSRFLDIPSNKESGLITALILALILTPPSSAKDFAIVASAGAIAIASKYVIVLNKSHLFNPAAIGALAAGQIFNSYPSWWVGTKFMAPVLIIGGLLVLRKMKRFTMVGIFLAVFILYLIYSTSSGAGFDSIWLALISTPLLFFAFIMLTEPQTSPALAPKYIPYAVVVGLGYSVAGLKLSPEEALLIGNLFTFLAARNRRYELRFIRKNKDANGIYSYLFTKPKGFRFQAGQYLEWTVPHNKTDSRGNRRYLTISSSPTEPDLMFTIKHPQNASSFKQRLDEMKAGDKVLASRLAGSFTLPLTDTKKIALLAGGVGISPFRSMVKDMVDANSRRDAALLYSASSQAELSFQKLFSQAQRAGLKTSYITEGRLDRTKIKRLLPDYKQRRFYVSGPYVFVNDVESALLKLGVSRAEIMTDYFPGYGN